MKVNNDQIFISNELKEPVLIKSFTKLALYRKRTKGPAHLIEPYRSTVTIFSNYQQKEGHFETWVRIYFWFIG
jgi:hypothetical protein